MSENSEISIIEVPMPENNEQDKLQEDIPIIEEEQKMNLREEEGAGVGVLVSEEVIDRVSEESVEVKVVVENPLGEELDKIVDNGLAKMVSRYLEDDVIDNDEMLDLVQYAMELAEGERNLTGTEKKQVALTILRKFVKNRVNNWSELEKLLSKTIDFAVDVSINGINKVKLTSNTIKETKTAFNLIYSSTMSQINAKYPLADDIINNFFDIAKHILELMEGQTSLSNNEKKVLLKKVLNMVIEAVSPKITQTQKDLLKTQVEPTVSMIMIGLRAKDGEISINSQEVMTLMGCLFGWMRRCFKKR